MDKKKLHQQFLQQGSTGYAVIRRFYSRYADVLVHSTIVSIDDVAHEVFISLSKTDFTRVKDVEHYVLHAIKLHCWSILDRSIRLKGLVETRNADDDSSGQDAVISKLSRPGNQITEVEGSELLALVNLFKAKVASNEAQLLNLLIDETPRSEIASTLGLKMNTLDTNIRRLRIRLADFLKGLGYSYKVLEKFE